MISGENYYVRNVSMIMIMTGQNVHDNHEFQRRWDFSARTGYPSIFDGINSNLKRNLLKGSHFESRTRWRQKGAQKYQFLNVADAAFYVPDENINIFISFR